MENTISIEIPAEVVASVTTKLTEIQALLQPYLVRVTEEEKKTLLKVGDKTIAFIDKVKDYMQSAPEFTPAYLDVVEFNRDKAALDSLSRIGQLGDQVMSMVHDTHALTANDSFAAALVYYNAVKQAAANGVAKAKAIYEDLSQRFPGRPRGVSGSPNTPD